MRIFLRTVRGFTLLELLIVVIIVGVLAAVASTQLAGAVEKSRTTEAITRLGILKRAQDAYYTGGLQYSASLSCLGFENSTNTSPYFSYVVFGTSCGALAPAFGSCNGTAVAAATRNNTDNSNGNYEYLIGRDGRICCWTPVAGAKCP